MQLKTEAPATEPPSIQGTSVVVSGVTRRFAKGAVTALEGLDLEVRPGEVLGVVGPSGCGKSTLLELVAGLQRPDEGSVHVDGEAAYMPQRDLLLPWRDALGNAALALECQGVGRKEARARARPLFERFGLADFEGARPGELSGGMRQRVAFMRTLLAGRPVLLLDEPFASLDAITRGEMQEWLATALATESRTAVLVTHDVEEALYLCDRVAVLSARPARVLAEVRAPGTRLVPRLASITSPRFVEARERALAALYEGRR